LPVSYCRDKRFILPVKGYSELKRLGDGRIHPLHGLEGNRTGDLLGGQLGEREDVAVRVEAAAADTAAHEGSLLAPSPPVVHHALRLRDPGAQRVLHTQQAQWVSPTNHT